MQNSSKRNANAYSNKRKLLIFFTVLAVFACLAVIASSALSAERNSFMPYESNIVYEISNLDYDTKYENSTICRTGYITEFEGSTSTKGISKSAANAVFQCSNFYDLLSDDVEHNALYDGDKLNSLNFTWRINDSVVEMIIDPSNSPDFLLNAESGVQEINGCKVAARKSSCFDGKYEIDIGLEKDGVGIWIYGGSENEEYINELFNLAINRNIDLSGFQA